MVVRSKEGKVYKAHPHLGLKLRWDNGQKPVIPYRVEGETIVLLDIDGNPTKSIPIDNESLTWVLFMEKGHEFLLLTPDEFSHYIKNEDYTNSLF